MRYKGAIESTDELIRLNCEKLKLLQELRRNLALCEYFGVNVNDVEAFGFDPYHRSAQFGFSMYEYACDRDLEPDLGRFNYVVLKSGERVYDKDVWTSLTRALYKKWREERLNEWAQGKHLFRPDVSPAEWKRAFKTQQDQKRVNRIEPEPEGTPEGPGPAA